jgi:hypothetical protein
MDVEPARKVLDGERAIAASDIAAAVSVELEAGKVALAADSRDPALPAAHAAMNKARAARISALARIGQIDSACALVEKNASPATDKAHERKLIFPNLDKVPKVMVRLADSRTAIFDQRIVGPEGTAESSMATSDQRIVGPRGTADSRKAMSGQRIVGPATFTERDATRRYNSAIGGSLTAL